MDENPSPPDLRWVLGGSGAGNPELSVSAGPLRSAVPVLFFLLQLLIIEAAFAQRFADFTDWIRFCSKLDFCSC
jgi:hypothetical protein